MEEALKVEISAIILSKPMLSKTACFKNYVRMKTTRHILLHTEVRWLSKRNSIVRLVELWDMVHIFAHHMETSAHSKKQKDKAETLFFGIK